MTTTFLIVKWIWYFLGSVIQFQFRFFFINGINLNCFSWLSPSNTRFINFFYQNWPNNVCLNFKAKQISYFWNFNIFRSNKLGNIRGEVDTKLYEIFWSSTIFHRTGTIIYDLLFVSSCIICPLLWIKGVN